MLAWIIMIMIVGFFIGSATFITASCYQLFRLFREIPREKQVPFTNVIEV